MFLAKNMSTAMFSFIFMSYVIVHIKLNKVSSPSVDGAIGL